MNQIANYSLTQELNLKAILSISKQDKCLLLTFCQNNSIDCEGERTPWCKLEVMLHENKCPTITKDKLLKENIIQILISLQSRLNIDDILNKKIEIVDSIDNFTCPFFRKEVSKCNLKICQYHTPIVKQTNCLLSMKTEIQNRLPLSKIIIAKNIPKKNLLKLIFGIEIGKKWETMEQLVLENLGKVEVCEKCGNLLEQCKNVKQCKKRQRIIENLENECLIPDKFLKYPLFLLLVSTYKIFDKWFYFLFSKKIIKHYLKQ